MEGRVKKMSSNWKVAAVVVALGGLWACGGGSSSGTAPSPVPTPTPVAPEPSEPVARYRVTFDATWTQGSHPTDFPPRPHFSPLIGGTHSEAVVFWETGSPASPGIEAMSEEGATSPLDAEIQAAIASGTAEGLIQGGGINPSPGSTSVEFQITRDFPLVTLVSMIAPSPDWFVGVRGLSMIENGEWVAQRTMELAPYDAGTDSGPTFRSRNMDTQPQEPISRLEGFPVESGAPFGTFTFVRLED
jgi:hypothetical protein